MIMKEEERFAETLSLRKQSSAQVKGPTLESSTARTLGQTLPGLSQYLAQHELFMGIVFSMNPLDRSYSRFSWAGKLNLIKVIWLGPHRY